MGRSTCSPIRKGLRTGALLMIIGMVFSANADEQQINRLDSLTVTETATTTELVLNGSAPPTFTVFKLTGPTRLFIDVSNADISAVKGPIEVENGVISQITPLQFSDDLVRIGRLVIGLETDALYSVNADGNRLVVSVDATLRKKEVAVNPQTAAELAAARTRAADAEARARAAEQKAQAASTAAEQIQARLRDAEQRAQTAQAQATSSKERAAAAEQQAARLAQDVKAAEAAAKTAQAESKDDATAAVTEAQARARRAEDTARAARAEAEAAARVAETRIAAANARAAEAEAQVKAANARQSAEKKDAAALSARATELARVAQEAVQRAEKAEADLSSAQAVLDRTRAQAAQDSRSAAERIAQAEARARQAEARAETVAESARADIAAAEAKARNAEVAALRSAERAKQQAQAADDRASAAERQAAELVTAASRAREDARNSSASIRAAAEQTAREAENKAEAAAARAQAARSEAAAAADAANARVLAAEARAQEAEARARVAEANAKASKADAADTASRADQLARTAEDAERRARQAESNLEALYGQLNQAKNRIEASEAELSQAQERTRQAQAVLDQAKGATEQANARAVLAESKVAEAQSAARAAELRATAANQQATSASARAEAAEARAQALRQTVQTGQDEQLASQAEATARAAAAEARATQLEADRARLTQQVRTLETQRSQSQATIETMQSERATLNARLAAARAAKDTAEAQALEAESTAKQAAVDLERARVAQIESAQAVSRVNSRVKALEAEAARAQQAQDSVNVERLNRELAAARNRVQSLEVAVQETRSALQQAEALSRTRADESVALRARVNAAPSSAPVATTPRPAPTTVLPPPPPQFRTRVVNVKFTESSKKSEIAIQLEGKAAYTVRKEGTRTRILELTNALIDPAIERSLDTSEFGGSVQLVSSFQAPPPGDRVRIVVTLNDQVKDQVVETAGRLVWSFDRPSRTIPAIGSLPPPPTWTAPSAPSVAGNEVRFERSKAAVFTGLNQAIATRGDNRPAPTRRKRYSGRKINIDIKDGDIHNILRLLAKEGNINIVTSDEVKGKVTMHLKLVPWDQALDIILRTKGLDMVRENDIIRVAPIESIAKEREAELKKQEVKEKLKPLEVKLITVNHASASDLMPRVKSVLSKRGTSEFDTRTNTVILKDIDDHLDAAEDIIRRLDTQTPQVLIETRIVEVNEVNVQQFGIQWGIDSTYSAATGNPTGLRFPSSVGISGGADDQQGSNEGVSTNPNYVVNLPAAAGLGSGGALGLTFGSIDSTFNLNVRLTALENRGSVKIVSSPKITTLDNKQASISQGVSIPISQVSAAGIQTTFFDAVLSLKVTPHVTQDGNIYLKLDAQNNTPDFQNVGARGDPTILKKEAKTELLLKDGDTTVIGGIYTSNAGFNRSEVPYLARIPILGAMFRNHQESDRRSELLIFVTPRIVNRSASQVRTAP